LEAYAAALLLLIIFLPWLQLLSDQTMATFAAAFFALFFPILMRVGGCFFLSALSVGFFVCAGTLFFALCLPSGDLQRIRNAFQIVFIPNAVFEKFNFH